MKGTDVAAAFHERLVWLVRDSGFTQTEIARRVGRSQGTVSEWLSEEDWTIPDGETMLRLPGALSREERTVNMEWLFTGKGSPYAAPSEPGALFYHGALSELAAMELRIKERRADLLHEQGANPNGGESKPSHRSSAADRVARTSQALRDAAKPEKRHRRSG